MRWLPSQSRSSNPRYLVHERCHGESMITYEARIAPLSFGKGMIIVTP